MRTPYVPSILSLDRVARPPLPSFIDMELSANTSFLPGSSSTSCFVKDQPDNAKQQLSSSIITTTVTAVAPHDVFWALGGYQDLGTGGGCDSNNDRATRCAVLTRIGRNLCRTLDAYVQDTLWHNLTGLLANINSKNTYNKKSSVVLQQWELPGSMKMTTEQVRRMLGVHLHHDPQHNDFQNKESTKKAVVAAPSWLSVIQQQHAGKKYLDKQLPLIHLLACTSTNDDASTIMPTSSTTTTTTPTREQLRRASWQTRPQRGWHQRLLLSHGVVWQVLAVTGPCLEVDSRPLQLQLVQLVLDWYRALVPHARVRARVVPPSQLLTAEASCVVLEGMIRGRTKRGTTTVCLGYVSNFLSYASRNVRLAGSTRREGLHVLQGTLCSIPETMEWILRHSDCSSATHLTLPDCLVCHGGSRHLAWVRRFVVRKNGARIAQDVVAEPMVVVDVDSAETRATESSTTTTKQMALRSSPSSRSAAVVLTEHEIRLEARSCPFNFLPFYYR
jgi:hypothetical protein